MMWTSRSSSSTDIGQSANVELIRLLEVGRVGRPHGLSGEVTVSLVSNRPERLSAGTEFHTDAGLLRISSTRGHQSRLLVRFEGIDDRAQAETLRGLVLRAEPLDDPDELWVHELIGAKVLDQSGCDRGVVTGVADNPAGDLLELDNGALVPLRFVVDSSTAGLLRVDTPEGLFDLTP